MKSPAQEASDRYYAKRDAEAKEKSIAQDKMCIIVAEFAHIFETEHGDGSFQVYWDNLSTDENKCVN